MFLDTMTLHNIRLCLEHANKEELQYPTDNKAISDLKKSFDNVQEKGLKQAFQTGLETIVQLSKYDIQIEYASVSEIEMITGLTEGKVRLALADEGVPYRIWSGFSEKETRERITVEELDSIKTQVDNLGLMLRQSGLTVTQSDTRREDDVIRLAKGIVGLIYMREIDSIIYASAIIAGAECLFTADGNLSTVINSIQDGRDQRYRDIRQKLKNLFSSLIPGDRDKIDLPNAIRVTQDGTCKGISIDKLKKRLT